MQESEAHQAERKVYRVNIFNTIQSVRHMIQVSEGITNHAPHALDSSSIVKARPEEPLIVVYAASLVGCQHSTESAA